MSERERERERKRRIAEELHLRWREQTYRRLSPLLCVCAFLFFASSFFHFHVLARVTVSLVCDLDSFRFPSFE